MNSSGFAAAMADTTHLTAPGEATRIVTGKERAIKLAREIIRSGGAGADIINLARQYLRELALPE